MYLKTLTLAFCTVLNLLPVKHAAQRPMASLVPVIFDTDIGNDIDDVLALQMLFNYEKAKRIKLLGITISKPNARVIEYVDGYCRFNNRGDIPLGYVYKGVIPDGGKYVPQTLDTVIDGQKILHPKRSIKDNLLQGFKLQRKLLASQKDHSVVMIVVGPETNIQRLLNSKGDEYSPLSGVELVQKKVRLLSVMGGLYGNEFDFAEWNLKEDIKASQTLFSKWPTEIVASGWELGNKLLYPHTSILNDFNDGYKHPLCVSYKAYEKMPYDRQTWDLTSVLYAIEPDKNYFGLSQTGTIEIDNTGKSIFTPQVKGKHRYLKIDSSQVNRTLKALVEKVTNKK